MELESREVLEMRPVYDPAGGAEHPTFRRAPPTVIGDRCMKVTISSTHDFQPGRSPQYRSMLVVVPIIARSACWWWWWQRS